VQLFSSDPEFLEQRRKGQTCEGNGGIGRLKDEAETLTRCPSDRTISPLPVSPAPAIITCAEKKGAFWLTEGAERVRKSAEIEMVSGVPKHMAPENCIAFDQEQPGHNPGVTHGLANPVAFQRGARSGQPHCGSEQIARATRPDAEGGVEPPGRVRHGAGTGPVAAEERDALADGALIDEHDRRVCGVRFAGAA